MVACRSVVLRVGVGRYATLGPIEALVVLRWNILVDVYVGHGRRREARRCCKLLIQATAGARRAVPVHGGDGASGDGAIDSGRLRDQMHAWRRPIRLAMSIAIFRIVVVVRTVVIIRTLDPIPGLILCFRLSVPLGAGTASCGSMAWVVLLCPTASVQLRAVDRRCVT